jgi:hypothetical protein
MPDSIAASLAGFVAILWIVIAIYALACPVFCMQAARSKGYSGWSWFFAGLFFGPIALLAMCAMARKGDHEPRETLGPAPRRPNYLDSLASEFPVK